MLDDDPGRPDTVPAATGRQAYLLQREGSSSLNKVRLDEHDASEIVKEDVLVVEMARPEE